MTELSRIDRTWAAVAGLAFAAFPAVRPWGEETDPATFADQRWIVAHGLGMVGFVALALALRRTPLSTPAWLAAALVLPYVGAEAFGLHALGRRVVSGGDPDVLGVSDLVRYQPVALTTFGVGLVLLGVVGVRLAWRLREVSRTVRSAAGLVAVGLALYLPQFFLPAPGRIAHGVVLGAGLVLLAALAGRGADADRAETSAVTAGG